MTPALRAFLLPLLALLPGCPGLPGVRPYPEPRAEELVRFLQTTAARLETLRGRAKADYHEGATRVRLTVSLLAARPDRLRLAAENTLAGPLLTLATAGHQFQLLDVRDNRFLTGQVAPCVLARVIRVELSAQEVVDLLLGGAALPEPVQGAELSWDGSGGGREVLTVTGPAGRQAVVQLDAIGRRWDLLQVEMRNGAGVPLWRVRHEGFRDHMLPASPPLRLPDTTIVEDIVHRNDLRLRWKERELNPSLPENAFRLEPPLGVPTDVASCGSDSVTLAE
ncbi:MAG: DUF4292 domain-containing protein [Myxococcota bacterium]|nr:DUF4292 domain-containing protein [Myxococcota bacterium]